RVKNVATQEILKAQFLGDLTPALDQRRLKYAQQVDRATMGVFGPKPGEKIETVQKASAALMDIYREYFAEMTPRKILQENGYLVPERLALGVLNRMIRKEDDD